MRQNAPPLGRARPGCKSPWTQPVLQNGVGWASPRSDARGSEVFIWEKPVSVGRKDKEGRGLSGSPPSGRAAEAGGALPGRRGDASLGLHPPFGLT